MKLISVIILVLVFTTIAYAEDSDNPPSTQTTNQAPSGTIYCCN